MEDLYPKFSHGGLVFYENQVDFWISPATSKKANL